MPPSRAARLRAIDEEYEAERALIYAEWEARHATIYAEMRAKRKAAGGE